MNGKLAFTWVPNPKRFVGTHPKYQFNDTVLFIEQMRNSCDYFKILPELTINGNIHFHGTIQIKDKVKWYRQMLPKLKYNGFVLLKDNPDDNWDKYIMKDRLVMQNILDIDLPIFRTERPQSLYNPAPELDSLSVWQGMVTTGIHDTECTDKTDSKEGDL